MLIQLDAGRALRMNKVTRQPKQFKYLLPRQMLGLSFSLLDNEEMVEQ
jgi:hypothetical protein